MCVSVVKANGDLVVSTNIEPTATVQELQHRIHKATGIKPVWQQLMHDSDMLLRNAILMDASVRDGSRLTLVVLGPTTLFQSKLGLTGLDTCTKKPIVATCGLDRSVRIFDYSTHKLEFSASFSKEPHAVALHPSGDHLIIAFSDKLRVLKNLVCACEVPIARCSDVHFSDDGATFAAAHGNLITMVDFESCRILSHLRGHAAQVRFISYEAGDSDMLLSCGQDGALYRWETRNGWQDVVRVGEWVRHKICLSCVLGSARSTFVAGFDNVIREFQPGLDFLTREEIQCSVAPSKMAVSCAEDLLFVGTSENCRRSAVRAYALPLTGEYLELAQVGGVIAQMRVSHDDQHLFVIDHEGCLTVFNFRAIDLGTAEKQQDPKLRTKVVKRHD